MQKFLLFVFTLCLAQFAVAQAPVINVSGQITTNTTWTKGNIYLLQGFVYVKNNATLTIEAGTTIKGDKDSKGSLIVTRGAKIMADGTAESPIVFTSNQPVGDRNYGDWGGIIILGKATVNDPAGQREIEGGVNNAAGDGLYGGTNDADNSGIMRYVRIEFPGIAFQPNSEINGLTLGGVGNGTTLEYIQVSYSGDDAFEWFGGTVNAKHLIAYRTWDDDFDTDYGFRGKIQYAVALRDPNVADQSGSNGFESDNDGTGTYNMPYTNAIFSNVTIVGPQFDGSTVVNSNYKRAAHIRRNSRTSIYNSVFMGYPTGLLLDGAASQLAAANDSLQIRNSIFITFDASKALTVESGSTFNVANWYNTAAYGNTTYSNNAAVEITNAFNLDNPNFLPMTGSPLLLGADFSNANLDNFFTDGTFKGAFGTTDWTAKWSNFTPSLTNYTFTLGVEDLLVEKGSVSVYPNPAVSEATISFNTLTNTFVTADLTDLAGRTLARVFEGEVSGKVLFNVPTQDLANGIYFVKIQAGSQTIATKVVVKR